LQPEVYYPLCEGINNFVKLLQLFYTSLSPAVMPSVLPFMKECNVPGLLQPSGSIVLQVLQQPKEDTGGQRCQSAAFMLANRFFPSKTHSFTIGKGKHWGRTAMLSS